MSNVRKEKGGGGVPEELRLLGATGDVKKPPDTITGELSGASGKAKMNFKHRPLGPETDYVDGETGDPSRMEDRADKMKGKESEKGDRIKHRSTSGAAGHGIVGN
jgi:hypothetical protein